jgi:hypothetical protein
MTADRDVALCLIQHDILDIMKCVIEESIAPRLTVKLLFVSAIKFQLT